MTNERKIKIRFINNDGGGFTQEHEIPAETTIGQFFAEVMPSGTNASDLIIRVNNESAAPGRSLELKDSDKVSITPNKVSGA